MKPINRTLFREYRENEGNVKDRRVAIKHTQKKKARKKARQSERQFIVEELDQIATSSKPENFMTLEEFLKKTYRFNALFKKPTDYAIKQVTDVFGEVNYEGQQFDVSPDGDGGLTVEWEIQDRTLEVVAPENANETTEVRWTRSVHDAIENPKASEIEALKRWLLNGDTQKPSFY